MLKFLPPIVENFIAIQFQAKLKKKPPTDTPLRLRTPIGGTSPVLKVIYIYIYIYMFFHVYFPLFINHTPINQVTILGNK